MTQPFSRPLIELAIERLEDQRDYVCASEIRGLLAYVDKKDAEPKSVAYKCWISEENLDGMVRAIYPPSPDWDEATTARHFRMLKHAIQAFPEILNEDMNLLLERFEANKKSNDIAKKYAVIT